MSERTCRFKIIPAVLGAVFVLAGAAAAQTATTMDKADHARRLWQNSPHADKTSEAFIHWNADGSIPASCAKCHSTPGFRDYLGADGSAADAVNATAALGTTVECAACHTKEGEAATHDKTYVIFPSGVRVSGLGPEAMCMECHQGRASTISVNNTIAAAGPATDDTPTTRIRFVNIHYFAASASQFGTVAKGGYEYEGKTYDARFAHVPGYNSCIVCHSPHSLEIDIRDCNTCHIGVKDPKDIRYIGSFEDYDGDGNITEGMYYEIEALKSYLLDAIRAYARTVIDAPIGYDPATNPYWFFDLNDDGTVDSNEATSANSYNKFSARLLRAVYNYQVSVKEPCGYVHNGKYIIELMYDSIEDLNTRLGASGGSTAVGIRRPGYLQSSQSASAAPAGTKDRELTLKGEVPPARNASGGSADAGQAAGARAAHGSFHRTDEGHFDGSSMAFRDWDDTGTVPATCAKCHSAEGLPTLLETGSITTGMPAANGFLCSTCHTVPPLTRPAGPVTFPSGAVLDLHDSSNLCLNCHQGRAAKRTVDTAIAAGSGPYSFTNIHYFAAAASFFGSEAHGGYEFEGKSYNGRNIYTNHLGRYTNCVECHFGTKSLNRKQDESDAYFHNTAPSPEDCVACHGQDISQPHPGADPAKFEFEGIRPAQTPDYDADGNVRESLRSEIVGLEDKLYAQIVAYGNSIGAPVIYNPDAYPYWFKDLNGNGVGDPNELVSSNGYRFRAPLLRAAYNLHFSKKEPCNYIHNPLYFAQLLADSIGHLGGDVSAFSWR